jgi:Cu2+-exporting ATPase
MLLEVGIMLTTYMGVRFYEYYSQNKKSNNDSVIAKAKLPIKLFCEYDRQSKKSNTDSVTAKAKLPIKRSVQQNLKKAPVKETEQYYQRYFNISLVSLVLSAIRQFLYSPLAPLSFALYIYTIIPKMRRVENMVRKKRVNIDVFSFVGDTIVIVINQYFAAAIDVCLMFWSLQVITKAKDNSEKMLINVFEKKPSKVFVVKNNIEIQIRLEDVKINDIVVINMGEVVPVDGIAVKGMATIDQQALTGESQPVEKRIGDQLFASTLVMSGHIYMKVEKTGQETTIAKVGQILRHSIDFKSQIQLKGEQWADKATFPMLVMAGFILPLQGPVSTVVFMNSHFGARIRTFAPLETLNHLALASHQGVLVKDGRPLEELIRVDTILFDKTGTLTDEQPEIGQIMVFNNYERDEILTYTAAAERKLAHPIAKAIVQKAKEFHLDLPEIEDSKYIIGYGITVSIGNKLVQVGSVRFMKKEGIMLPKKIQEIQAHCHDAGHSLILIAINHQVSGTIEIQPQIRPEVKNIVNRLRKQGIKHIAIVSGDHKQPTQKLAEELGMDSYFYDTLPENKAQIVEQMQKAGKSVCFIGDGVNDTLAMKKANVSISLQGASTIATDVAEMILMDGNLSRLCDLIDVSKSLETNLQKNILLALTPTVVNLGGAFLLHFGVITSILVSTSVLGKVIIDNARHSLKKK